MRHLFPAIITEVCPEVRLFAHIMGSAFHTVMPLGIVVLRFTYFRHVQTIERHGFLLLQSSRTRRHSGRSWT